MVSLFSTGHRLLGKSRQTELAAQLAKNKMETLRNLHPVVEHKTEQVDGAGMTRKWSIVPNEKDPSLWVITVEVFPTNEPNRSFTLKSLLYY
jgi:hypothetical protein